MVSRLYPQPEKHVGPIWVTVWDPYGASVVFGSRSRMGNPYRADIGPIWVPYGLYMWPILVHYHIHVNQMSLMWTLYDIPVIQGGTIWVANYCN